MKIPNSVAAAAKTPATSSTGWDKVILLLLAMCTVQFFGAWFYPKYEFGGAALANPTKTLGVPFQYSLWLLILFTAMRFLRQRGVTPFVEVLRPFLPFFLIGVVASAFGIDPFGSVKMLILWTLMALSAVVLGYSLRPERLLRGLVWIFFVMLLVSALWSVGMPSYGLVGGEGGNMWRGLFQGKSGFGWVAALILVVSANASRQGARRLPMITVMLAVVCLIFSGSKGALMAALAALAYSYFVPRLMRHVTPGFGVFIVLVGGLCTIVFAALALPFILDLLGRDITLTGRTTIWKMYFASMSDTPWLGQGPGAYTGLSAITSVLASRLTDLGAIATPHSIYLGMLGDAGLFGLVIFIGLMIYMSLIAPAVRSGQFWMLSGTIGFLIVVDGLVETHEIFSPGPGWFLLILLRAMALQQDKISPPEQPVQPGMALPQAAAVARRRLTPAMRKAAGPLGRN